MPETEKRGIYQIFQKPLSSYIKVYPQKGVAGHTTVQSGVEIKLVHALH